MQRTIGIDYTTSSRGRREFLGLQKWMSVAMLVFVAGTAYVALRQRPFPEALGSDAPAGVFAAARATEHLQSIATIPHPIGSSANEAVGFYILNRLTALGLEPETQEVASTYPRGSGYVAARVRNIIANKRGYSNTRHVLLMAHYDSAITSPGAGDDGSAVAALLEACRALQAGPALRNDVVFLFTDGEELGLAGARAFVKEHRWAKDAGVVLNFEARGSTGPSTLFETINGDGWLIDQFSKVSNASGSSLLPALYRLLPNDTDLSVFKATGVPGLNFAFAEQWSHYHSPLDSLDSIDPRSVQHHGEYALELATRFAGMDLTKPIPGNAIFFNMPGVMVSYPESLVPLLTGLAVLIFLAGTVLGLRKKRLTMRGLLAGFTITAVAVAAAALLTNLSLLIVGRFIRQGDAFFESPSYGAGVVCLALATITFSYALLSRRTSFENIHQGALLCWAVLAVAAAVFLPGASYLFMWPLIVGVAMSSILFLIPEERKPGYLRLATVCLAALPILLLLAPIAQQILIAAARRMGFIAAGLAALTVGLLLPLYRFIASSRRYLAPALLGCSAIALIGAAILGSKPGIAYPKNDHIFYLANLDQGSAIWATLESREDPWTSQFLGGQGSIGELSEFCPDLMYPGATILRRPAPKVALEPPTVRLVGDGSAADEMRHLNLKIASPSRSPEISIFVESNANLLEAKLDGVALHDERVDKAAFKEWSSANGRTNKPQLSIHYYGLPQDGANLSLDTRGGAGVTIHVFERRYRLPSIANFEIRPRSAGLAEARVGDGTIAYRSFKF